MPAQLQFFDMEANLPASQAVDQPIPVTTGSNWQPGDIRVFAQLWFQPLYLYHMQITGSSAGAGSANFNGSGHGSGSGTANVSGSAGGTSMSGSVNVSVSTSDSGSGSSSWGATQPSQDNPQTFYGPNFLMEPPGYNSFGNILPTDAQQELGYSVSWRRLIPGDTNTFIVYSLPASMSVFSTLLYTVRGVDPAWTGTGNNWGKLTFPNSGSINTASSVTIPGAGTMVYMVTSYPAPAGNNSASAPWVAAQNTGASMNAPAGWTNLIATSSSGTTYFPFYSNSSAMAMAKSYSAAGSTGLVSITAGPATNPIFDGPFIWFKPAPDVVGVAGNVNTTNTVTAAVFGSSPDVIGTAGSITTTNDVTTAFNANLGYWISDPLALTGAPVTGSIVRWTATTPSTSNVSVQTSINSGASWDNALNNQPIPRLKEGDVTTQFVLAKITLTRPKPPTLYPGPTIFMGPHLFMNGSPPRVSYFELDVSNDSSVDELVPIGFGMIDKVTVHATAGTTGSGSSTNVVGSTGVVSRGGGQTGGGTSLKIHVNDMSYAIKRNVWQMPFTLPGGMLYSDAIQAMVLNRLPSQLAFNISTTTRVCPLLVYGAQQGGDPWQDIQELAQAIGYEAYFDAVGTFVCRPVPNPQLGDPVWQFDEDTVQLVAEAERELSSEQTFNDIVVVGQSTSTANPFSAESYDDNPSSPTYVLGPYGRVTQRLTFSLITSQDQAQDTANATLYNSLGGADTVTLTVVPMPALEPGDIIRVNCSNVRANGTYMINSMTTPMSPADPQVLTCFRQSTDLFGTNQSSSQGVIPGPPNGTIVPVNTFQNSGTASGTLTSENLVAAAVGNCIVVWAAVLTGGSASYSNISGGGVTTWHRITSSAATVSAVGDQWSLSMWFGVVTAPGSKALSLSTSGSSGSVGSDSWVGAQEFSLTGGSSATTWALDGTQQGARSGSSVNIAYPSLTPSGANRLYVGGQIALGTQISAVSNGYTIAVQPYPMLAGAIWGTSVPNSVQAPISEQGAATFGLGFSTLGALIVAT